MRLSTCNGEKIEVSKELNLKKLLIAFGFGYKSSDQKEIFKQTNLVAKLLLECRDLRITNSVYDLMMVAEGKYGGIICGGKIWDHIAPEIIIKEAGGEYSDFFGKPLGYSNPLADLDKQYSIFSAAPEIHKKLQDIINKNA
ncbi:hypothetical protein HY025_04305 [Candidatus Daviesbacteria bacterium]|nr:hypothetical protein [Candidatus Daviesbacteria bacterium]